MTPAAVSSVDTGPTSGSPSESETGLPPISADDRISLSQVFAKTDGWQENKYNFAGKVGVQGMASLVQGCGSDSSQVQWIELRLQNKFTELDFDVSQSDSSKSSDQRLTAEVVANGQQVDIDTVPFNKIKAFTRINLRDVNALKIRLFLDDKVEGCSYKGGVEAVLSNVVVR
ncbi:MULTISPECIES: hypothetical protein [Arsenicicoccus]|uniref:hypothetical protein n=1 Tax=Arsenicicoccus TaxID=267408 RepID=UPI00257D3FA0|nr:MULTISPECIES: hypothetical protein [Arsenicicoccus]